MTNDCTLAFKLPYKLKMRLKKAAKTAGMTQTQYLNAFIQSAIETTIVPPTELGSKYKSKQLITHNTEHDNSTHD